MKTFMKVKVVSVRLAVLAAVLWMLVGAYPPAETYRTPWWGTWAHTGLRQVAVAPIGSNQDQVDRFHAGWVCVTSNRSTQAEAVADLPLAQAYLASATPASWYVAPQ